jgi:hypothetical protein
VGKADLKLLLKLLKTIFFDHRRGVLKATYLWHGFGTPVPIKTYIQDFRFRYSQEVIKGLFSVI